MIKTETCFEDLEISASAEFIPWDELRDQVILITGATGLIGSSLIDLLLYANKKKNLGITILALVRDEKRAFTRFCNENNEKEECLKFIIGSVEEFHDVEGKVDYIIHGASKTASKTFVDQPVETILTALSGTENLLEVAKKKNVKGMVYLSSMEVYGYPERGHKVYEDEIGSLTPLDVRNSYPISKQQCESLCCAYAKEYDVPVMIARLTQTFGPGVNYNDNRIFAYFGRCVKEKQDIVLKTKGETERCYLYTYDAATAIIAMLLKGEPGMAYNVADEDTYCSITDMAKKVAKINGIQVHYEIQNEKENGFPATLYMDLSTDRLKSIGWKVLSRGITTMYLRMIENMIMS